MIKDYFVKLLKNIFGILGFTAPLVSDLGWKYNLVFIIVGLLITAIIHLALELNDVVHKKYIKVKGRVPGSGMLNGINILKLENNSKIPKEALMTLITKGSGISNTICILKVIESSKNEDIQAIQIFPDEQGLDINSYFMDMNKLENLYATVIIKNDELHTLKLNAHERV